MRRQKLGCGRLTVSEKDELLQYSLGISVCFIELIMPR